MVAVIMPVYQGGVYLKSQIDSILGQTYSDFHLYIRDDGSSDDSLRIIESYARHDRRVKIVESHSVRLGLTGSIKHLLSAVREETVFFADQDDVWLDFKIEAMLARFPRTAGPSMPAVVFSDLEVVDSNLKLIAPSFWEMRGIKPVNLKFRHVIRRNCVAGCACAINQSMLNMARKMPDDAVHDWWIAGVAAQQGILVPVYEQLVLYRQHKSNTIGAKPGGLAGISFLAKSPWHRKQYIFQLHKSLIHHKAFLNHPDFSLKIVDHVYLQKEIFRRRILSCVLGFFNRG